MKLERTPEGLEATLRSKGILRFFAAAFLLIWLGGWAVGESFALYVVWNGARAIFEGARAPNGGAFAIGLFLVVWLSFWTLGGLLALSEWLRLMWSEDRILVATDQLLIRRQLGPFRRTTAIARWDVTGIRTVPRRSRLVAETTHGDVVITGLADRIECEALERELRAALGIAETPLANTTPAAPPTGWTEVLDAEGSPSLVQDPAIRAAQARVAWLFAAALAIPTVVLVARILDHPQWGAGAVALATGASLAAWGAWRLSTTRREWRLGTGRITLRQRSGSAAVELFESGSLELQERSDSDGDSWFTLSAVAVDGQKRRKIVDAMEDPSVPRGLGAWIARRASIPFDDSATASRKAYDVALTIAQLEASGRLGRWMARKLKGS